MRDTVTRSVSVRAPGRANLIGEHTDYNDGLVLPVAIDRFISVRLSPAGDRNLRLRSDAFPGETIVPLDDWRDRWAGIGIPARLGWAAYPLGVVWSLSESGFMPPTGLSLDVSGNLPSGAGLSSSAALEVGTAAALRAAFGFDLSDVDLALACHRAENEFVGVNCGIMDQFVTALARAGHALLLDCRSKAVEHVPLPFEGRAAVVLCDTGVKHALSDSPYNRRRAECEEAVRLMGAQFPHVRSLRDLTVRDMALYDAVLGDPVRRRARHVVSEIDRVRKTSDRMRARDLEAVGNLLYASHDSLRNDYAVSCAELDCLVDAARAGSDAYGGRLTGAGFGGCTINLVKAYRVDAFAKAQTDAYRKAFGRELKVHVCRAVDGAVRSVEGTG
jgi:galactokinase